VEVRFCGVTAADRVRNGEAYGILQPPPHVLWETPTQACKRETGRRRPSKKGTQHGSRGEAIGECVFAAGAFSPAPADRVLPVRGTGAAAAPESTPARFDGEIRLGIQDHERVQRKKN
jgi:hypothetical protein